MHLQHALLQLLSDGRFCSGEVLALELGVSRTAIWKAFKLLSQRFDIQIDAVKGRGYRLATPLELLDKSRISSKMQHPDCVPEIQTYLSLDSTNHFLMDLATQGKPTGTVVFAEHQTYGRGRQGRSWYSPFGANLYFSLLWRFAQNTAEASGLSLAVAIGIVRALEKLGVVGLELKWPNDVMCHGRKLSGILLEMHGEMSGPYAVVVGVGLNVRMPANMTMSIDQPWIDLAQTEARDVSRTQLAATVLDELILTLQQFSQTGLAAFLDEWHSYDRYFDKPVVLQQGEKIITGISRGIDASGALLLEQPHGIQRFFSGDVRFYKGE